MTESCEVNDDSRPYSADPARHQLKHLSVEITTRCNAGCIACPWLSTDRRGQDMPLENVLRIIHEAAEMGVEWLLPHQLGEPTLHPDFPAILRAGKEAGLRIKGYTNGSKLKDDQVRQAIVEHSEIWVVSIDGASLDMMKQTRPGLEPEGVLRGVRMLLHDAKAAGRPSVIVRMTGMDENREEIDAFLAMWRAEGADPAMVPDIRYEPVRAVGKPCGRVLDQMPILVNGDAVLCCRDHHGEYVLGNVFETSLREAWEGPVMTEIQSKHDQGVSHEVDICGRCTYAG